MCALVALTVNSVIDINVENVHLQRAPTFNELFLPHHFAHCKEVTVFALICSRTMRTW